MNTIRLAWSFDPPLLVLAASVILAYALLAPRSAWRSGHGAALVVGVATLVLALVSPLHQLGECCLLSAHMVQHEIVLLLAPPLIAWGIGPLGEEIKGRWCAALSRPGLAVVLMTVNLYVWHIPAWHQIALRSATVHGWQHLLYLGTGIYFWWTVVGRSTVTVGARFAYLMISAVAMMPLGIILIGASAPLYPAYAGLPAIRGWSPLGDQQLAAVYMLAGGGAVLTAALTAGFLALTHPSLGSMAPGAASDDAPR